MKKYKITILAILGCIGLMGFSTAVNIGIKDMFDNSGRVKQISLSTGQTYQASTLATVFGGGSGNASYPINLAGGTETTGVLPITQGGWGTSTPNLAQVKQVNGTCTELAANNIAITGTNSIATFKTLTVTGQLETGSQWSTGGSWTSTVGVGQSARIISLGSSTNTISLECNGPIYANNGITSVDLTHMPQIWAKGSTTAGVISSISGTTQGTFTTFIVPANSMGKVGYLEILPFFYTGTNTTTNTIKAYFSDNIGTTTFVSQASLNTFWPDIYIRNTGSTSTQISANGFSTAFNTNSLPVLGTINTAATTTVTLCGNSSNSTGTVYFLHCIIKAYYVD